MDEDTSDPLHPDETTLKSGSSHSTIVLTTKTLRSCSVKNLQLAKYDEKSDVYSFGIMSASSGFTPYSKYGFGSLIQFAVGGEVQFE